MMAAIADRQCLGTAFLFVNSYRSHPLLATLPRIDEAAKDFWRTFQTLGFNTKIFWDLKEDTFRATLNAEIEELVREGTGKYVVFFFIGHGGGGDVLAMDDGKVVSTETIVKRFATSLPSPWKIFFVDACRGKNDAQAAYCPEEDRVLLCRSTLPYQQAHTRGTYGIWSTAILKALKTSEANLEATVKVVNGQIDQQQTQIIGNGMPDICWKSEADQAVALPPDIVKLSKDLESYRKGLVGNGSGRMCGTEENSAEMGELPAGTLPVSDVTTSIPPLIHPLPTTSPPPPTPPPSHSVDIVEALGHQLDAKWRLFGTFLRVDYNTMEAIEIDRLRKPNACMLELVSKWISDEVGTGSLPRTWQTVVEAVKKSGRPDLAEKLALEHGVTLSK